MFDLSGKTALVTGATGGIGAAIARLLHKQGATVAVSGTRTDVLEMLKAELGDRAHLFTSGDQTLTEIENGDITQNSAGR